MAGTTQSGSSAGSQAAAGHFASERRPDHDERWSKVDAYVLSHLHPASKANYTHLTDALDGSSKGGLPDISVCPTLGKFLGIQCRVVGAKRALEVGTLGAYSTIWMASMNPELHIVTLEVDEHHANVARENVKHAGLAERIDVRVGAALDTIATLEKEIKDGKQRPFDFVFIDADKENNWNYFDAGVRMGRKGMVLIVDNVVRQGALADAEAAKKNSRVQGARNLVENVGKDTRVEATVLQLVAEKNYDGILMATVV